MIRAARSGKAWQSLASDSSDVKGPILLRSADAAASQLEATCFRIQNSEIYSNLIVNPLLKCALTEEKGLGLRCSHVLDSSSAQQVMPAKVSQHFWVQAMRLHCQAVFVPGPSLGPVTRPRLSNDDLRGDVIQGELLVSPRCALSSQHRAEALLEPDARQRSMRCA